MSQMQMQGGRVKNIVFTHLEKYIRKTITGNVSVYIHPDCIICTLCPVQALTHVSDSDFRVNNIN